MDNDKNFIEEPVKSNVQSLLEGKAALICLGKSCDTLDQLSLLEQYHQLRGMKHMARRLGIPQADIDAITQHADKFFH